MYRISDLFGGSLYTSRAPRVSPESFTLCLQVINIWVRRRASVRHVRHSLRYFDGLTYFLYANSWVEWSIHVKARNEVKKKKESLC